jgi:NAD(P)-dependent dehydrogenase (short-subunit alcohol dehydrogenase family)
MREQLGAMIDQGSGAIVNVSSNMGLVGHEGMPAYCASKHGIIGLTKSAALDYARQGIRVNAVCPGPTDTPMVDKLIAASGMEILEMKRIVEANLPLQRLGRAEEIAAAIAWLGSDDASFITGAALSVDGGYVTR